MRWYDAFSHVYDLAIERVYAPYRQRVVEAAALQHGDRVLDLACGTGPNLPHLQRAVGPQGRVLGIDPSAGMLARARARPGHAAELLCATADAAPVQLALGSLDAVVVTLGLSVIPDPEGAISALVPRLRSGGRFVAFDVHAVRRVPTSWWVEWLAQADLRRDPAALLAASGLQVTREVLPGSAWIHGGEVVLAVGRLP